MQVVSHGVVSGFFALLLLSSPVAAAEPAATDVGASTADGAPDCSEQDATACGRRHFEAGTTAFGQGDFAAAAREFGAALAARPHPVIRFNLALAQARLGHPKLAIELLQQVQSDPAADPELRQRAAREQRSAEQALARVSVRLDDPSRERVELDAEQVKLEPDGQLLLDPGTHHVRVISGSAVVLDQEIELAPGERVELRVGERSRRIDVVVVPEAPSKPAAPAREQPRAEASPRPLGPAWFYVGAGATLVLTGLTVWSGIDTNGAYSDYQRDLPRLSQAQADERVANGHSRELRTNLLLAGSLVCGAGSAVLGLWLVDFSGKRPTRVGLSPAGLALSGRF